jgi:hypothetical protein
MLRCTIELRGEALAMYIAELLRPQFKALAESLVQLEGHHR